MLQYINVHTTHVQLYSTSILTSERHLRVRHFCFLIPLPPNLIISRHILHFPQSLLKHPGQLPHPLCLPYTIQTKLNRYVTTPPLMKFLAL